MLPFKWPTFFFFRRLRNHDYDMAINLMIVLMSYTSVELGRSDASFLDAICFLDFFLFLFAVI